MAKLADATDLGSVVFGRVGSNPTLGTFKINLGWITSPVRIRGQALDVGRSL